MEYHFTENLEKAELKQILKLYSAQEHVSILQHPLWMPQIRPQKKIRHFYAIHEKQLVCYAQIHEQKLKQVHIPFGPIYQQREDLAGCIKEIYGYYRRKNYLMLTVQLPMPVGNDSEYTDYYLHKELNIKYLYDRNNWTTSIIDLQADDQKIMADFTSDCRRNLKKSKRFNLHTEVLEDWEQVKDFHEIFVRMHKNRGLFLDESSSIREFKGMLDFFKEHQSGFFLGVFHEQKLIGAVAIIYQGHTAYYSHGASDPEMRNYPTLYLALYDSMNMSKSAGYHYMDFGGYNHMIPKNDQVHSINKFKDNFTRSYLFYPKLMYIRLMPFGINISRFLGNLSSLYKRLT